MTEHGPLLIVSPRIVGHFTVYAANCIRWALGRSMDVIFLGHDFEKTHLFAEYRDRAEVRFLKLTEQCPEIAPPVPPRNDAEVVSELFTPERIKLQAETVRAIQEEHNVSLTLLLNSDDMLFRSGIFTRPGAFAAPTFGVFTFGFRNHYAGFLDDYNRRLNAVLNTPSSLAGAFTLDEYHVRALDPEQRFLKFFPDPFRNHDPAPASELPEEDRATLERLEQFPAEDDRPLVPIIGKLDARKNVDWILELGLENTDLTFAVLGERVHGPEDERINALLTQLESEGRAFVHNRFAPEHLFDPVLASPRAVFLPLAYSGHYGSSAIQLHGLRNRLPCLVPDIGLMAFRTADHGLGRLYRHGDKKDFQAACRDMLKAPFTSNRLKDFTKWFSMDRLTAVLDAALDNTAPPPLPGPNHETSESGAGNPSFACCRAGLELLSAGDPVQAADTFRAGLDSEPGNTVLRFRLGLALCMAGDTEAGGAMLAALKQDDPENPEIKFLADSTADSIRSLHRIRHTDQAALELAAPGNLLSKIILDPADQEDFLQATDFVLMLDPHNADALHMKSVIYQETDRPAEALGILERLVRLESPNTKYHLQTKGGIHAALKQYNRATKCFRQALEIAPDFHDLRLNLSDTLRYAGRLDESMDALNALEHAAPGFPGLHLKKAQVLFESETFEQALAEYEAEQSPMAELPFFKEFSDKLRAALSEGVTHTAKEGA